MKEQNGPKVNTSGARLISIAWGESYVNNFLDLALPAALAPGNIPALAAYFDLEFILVTERRLFAQVRVHPAFKRLGRLCAVRLVPVDDLLVHKDSYGITLTAAFHRGFSDLGDAMTDYFLFFLNADFILAQDSYKTALEHIKQGARLLLSPSYCAVSRHVSPAMKELRSWDGVTLAIPKREMAAMVLEHRHNTIKGKTVNQDRVHMDFIEQFYWNIDEKTLLARQLPIAIVGLQPTRVYTKPVTFWDYGLLSEICPETDPCVLGDSDQFLMMELRHEHSANDKLRLGWPSHEDIARGLSTFTTEDQRRMSRYPLVVHSDDLPSGTAAALDEFDKYVDGVCNLLSTAIPHRGHPSWEYHSQLLDRYRRPNNLRCQLLGVEDSRENLPQLLAILDEVQIVKRPDKIPNRSWRDRLRYFNSGWPTRSLNHSQWSEYRSLFKILDKIAALRPRLGLIVASNPYLGGILGEAIPGHQCIVPSYVAMQYELHPVDLALANVGTEYVPSLAQNLDNSFDYCLICANGEDIDNFVLLTEQIRSSLRPGARIVAYLSNMPHKFIEHFAVASLAADLEDFDDFTVICTPVPMTFIARAARVIYRASQFARHCALGRRTVMSVPLGGILSLPFLMMAAILSRLVNRHMPEPSPGRVPAQCANVILVMSKTVAAEHPDDCVAAPYHAVATGEPLP